MNNNMFLLKPAADLQQLRASVVLVNAYANISQEDLENEIARMCDGLNRVGTPASLALVAMADGALRSALNHTGRADRLGALKSLAVWLSGVEVGWL